MNAVRMNFPHAIVTNRVNQTIRLRGQIGSIHGIDELGLARAHAVGQQITKRLEEHDQFRNVSGFESRPFMKISKHGVVAGRRALFGFEIAAGRYVVLIPKPAYRALRNS